MTYESTSLQETYSIAETFLQSIKPADHAVVVGLSGDLGSGKTTFTQAVARILGITETVTSPTFVIEKIYSIQHPLFKKIIHIDAYRLESGKELQKLNWQEIVQDQQNLIIIEWPEKVADILPKDMQVLKFAFVDETTRKIEVE